MATFSAKKLDLTKVNGGQEYEQGDFLQSDTINDVVEGTAYAQNVAEEANTKSNNAVSTANSANSTANATSEKVDKFDERITKAQDTADDAVSNAATAQGTADSATTEINKIKNGTTTVPNAQHAVSADSADLATKAKQDVNGNSIVDTYATKNEVAEKQGTKVYYGSALQTSVTFDSNPQTQLNSKANQNGSYKTLSAGALITDDTRSVNSPPSYYYGKGSKVTSEFKNCSTVGLPSDETYCTVVTICPWSDDSGGAITQTAFVGNTKYTRQSISDSAWSEWGVDLVLDRNKILPYTAANGWTRIERFSQFPPKENDPVGNNATHFYLIAIIRADSTDTSPDVIGEGVAANPPSLVYGGFAYINPEYVNCSQAAILLSCNIYLGAGSSDGYLLLKTSYLGIDGSLGIGMDGVILSSTSETIAKATDTGLDKISYVYKRIG